MLPAAVGFGVLLVVLLYSACLIETVDDEAPLRLCTTLPAHHSLTAHHSLPRLPHPTRFHNLPQGRYTHYGYAHCRRCSASSGAA